MLLLIMLLCDWHFMDVQGWGRFVARKKHRISRVNLLFRIVRSITFRIIKMDFYYWNDNRITSINKKTYYNLLIFICHNEPSTYDVWRYEQ